MNKMQKLFEAMNQDVAGNLKPPDNMKEYSQFLADFQAANMDKELEIPGMVNHFNGASFHYFRPRLMSLGSALNIYASQMKAEIIIHATIYANVYPSDKPWHGISGPMTPYTPHFGD